MKISDQSFISQFEKQTLDPCHFDHYGHLRLAWIYLNSYPLELAVEKVTRGISDYANSLGATDKFQHTLTEAIVRIMAERLKESEAGDLGNFLAANPDLVQDVLGLVKRYYSDALLASPTARERFVAPDLLPLEEPELV